MERVRGFSVVELLIVITVIGLLAGAMVTSFGAIQRSSRDDRRIADLKQVEQSLQLFHLKCGYYPGRYDASLKQCLGGLSTGDNNPSDWAALTKYLADAGAGAIPQDPSPGKSYGYFVQLGVAGNSTAPKAQCYVLWANLETSHKALGGDIDNTDLTKLSGGGPVWPVIPQCDDGNRYYCIGNIDCFHEG